MEHHFFDSQVFDGKTFTASSLVKGEYANCRFVNLHLAKADLSFFEFSDCVFDHCDLSLVTLKKTSFSEVRLLNCKLQGVNFEQCNEFLFTLNFDSCILNYASFYKRKLPKTRFTGCSLLEVDFTEADLSGADFSASDLAGAKFENTQLGNADFCTARQYSIDPETNYIRKAKFSLEGLPGLLGKYNIEIRPV